MPLQTPLVLSFDTSAAHCAVALFADGEVVTEQIEPMTKGQAERLFPLCEEVLLDAGITWADLDGVGVCVGPGNFTGVRVGVSAARGLALSLGKPAIGISKLDAMAFQSHGAQRVIMDARRSRVYVQDYIDGMTTGDPRLEPVGDVVTTDPIIMFADDALLDTFPTSAQPTLSLPSAVAHLAALRLNDDNPRPAPLYLQEPDAALPSDPPPVILP